MQYGSILGGEQVRHSGCDNGILLRKGHFYDGQDAQASFNSAGQISI